MIKCLYLPVFRCVGMGIALLSLTIPARAATFDIAAGDTPGLIAALDAAALQPNTAHIINLEPDSLYTLTEINNSQDLYDPQIGALFAGGDQGLPLIRGNITINGNGSIIERADDAPDFRFFLVDKSGRLTLNGLTLRNGRATNSALTRGGTGGAIFSSSPLFITDSFILNNHADAEGGGLEVWEGSLTVVHSVISNNVAFSSCGGFATYGDLSIIDSTVADNEAGYDDPDYWDGAGGGLCLVDGNARIESTAVINNRSMGSPTFATGGGIYVLTGNIGSGTVVEISNNSTISGNQAVVGGGIFNAGGPIGLRNVTIANNTATYAGGAIFSYTDMVVASMTNTLLADNLPTNCDGSLLYDSDGSNIDSDGSCQLDQGSDLSNVDPLIEPLGDNGGPTLTHALAASSLAIDHANRSRCPTRDQRGVLRGSACDIGAYEYIPPPVAPILIAPVDLAAITSQQPIFSWHNTGAVRYEIQLDTSDPPEFIPGIMSANQFTPPGPLLSRTYYWRVRSLNELNQTSDWSDQRSFSVNDALGSAPLINEFTTASVNLTWGMVSWAVGYEVQVDNYPTFSSPEYRVTINSPTILFVTVSDLPNGFWYWRMRARRVTGQWGNWSPTQNFTVNVQ